MRMVFSGQKNKEGLMIKKMFRAWRWLRIGWYATLAAIFFLLAITAEREGEGALVFLFSLAAVLAAWRVLQLWEKR